MLEMICFDMDGTIADLYRVPNWLARLRQFDPTVCNIIHLLKALL